jgi:exonuclease III
MNTGGGLITGRPHRGIAILWRKTMGPRCTIKEFDDPRIMGLEVSCGSSSILIVNVYFPYACEDNADSFDYFLSMIDSIITVHGSPYVYIAGDFNADLRQGNGKVQHMFGRRLLKFCEEESLVMADKEMLDNTDVFTFYSDAHGSVSWLDHMVTTTAGNTLITVVSIDNSFVSSDHFPIIARLQAGDMHCVTCKDDISSKCARINWVR